MVAIRGFPGAMPTSAWECERREEHAYEDVRVSDN